MSLEWFQAVGWPTDPFTCTCDWDIPRSDCCTCGANARAEEAAHKRAKVLAQQFASLEHYRWAFGGAA